MAILNKNTPPATGFCRVHHPAHLLAILIHSSRGCFTLTTDKEEGCSAQYPFDAAGKDCHKGQGPVSIGWNVHKQDHNSLHPGTMPDVV